MHKGFLLLLWSTAHLCAISALYAVPPKKERLPAVFLCFDQWSVKNMFLFLCRFEDVVYSRKIQFHENMSFLCFSGKQMKNFHLFIRVFRAQDSLLRVFLSACRAQKIPAGAHGSGRESSFYSLLKQRHHIGLAAVLDEHSAHPAVACRAAAQAPGSLTGSRCIQVAGKGPALVIQH